ncbi:MAG: ATP-binding protein [Chloroflexota bacterium]|nr:ATP-binding protein [Chloroflexota bacterium]
MPKARILVADDDKAVLNMCVRTLERAGHEVTGVESGPEALSCARARSFDLFITDLRMPQMTGLEACRAMHDLNPHVGMIIMTAFGSMESAIEALEIGVSQFVLKPFRPGKLLAAVERALAKRQREWENARLRTLVPLLDLSRAFMHSTDLASIPKCVVRIAKEETQASSASVMLLDGDVLTIHAAEGLPPDVVAETRQKADEGIAGYAIVHREPLVLEGDLKHDARFQPQEGSKRIETAVSLPLIHKNEILGVLNVSKMGKGSTFTKANVEFLSILASQAAAAIDNARLFREIQDAYERLEELDHLKSEFISIASHELRAPLTVLLAYATLLGTQAPGSMREHLDQVVGSAMQLKSVIDEMISLQRIDTGQTQMNLTHVDIKSALNHAVDELKPLAKSKEQIISVGSIPQATVRADEQMLDLILRNLVSNAIKFTPEEGTISLSAESREQEIIVTLRDTGVGIPQEKLGRIFERFYQAEKALRREHGGIGLGLAIAREMAELMDGRIWAESEVGKGSTFYLSLPREQ